MQLHAWTVWKLMITVFISYLNIESIRCGHFLHIIGRFVCRRYILTRVLQSTNKNCLIVFDSNSIACFNSNNIKSIARHNVIRMINTVWYDNNSDISVGNWWYVIIATSRWFWMFKHYFHWIYSKCVCVYVFVEIKEAALSSENTRSLESRTARRLATHIIYRCKISSNRKKKTQKIKTNFLIASVLCLLEENRPVYLASWQKRYYSWKNIYFLISLLSNVFSFFLFIIWTMRKKAEKKNTKRIMSFFLLVYFVAFTVPLFLSFHLDQCSIFHA